MSLGFLAQTFLVFIILPLGLWTFYGLFFGPSSKPCYRRPPGPAGESILGHLRIVPTNNPEVQYHQWGKQYGDILYFNILGQPVVVLNSVKPAVELLEKKGSIYCDRPDFHLFRLMGWRETLTFLRWGPQFQMHRRALQNYFTKPQIVRFQGLQTSEARKLVQSLIEVPEDFDHLIRRFATAVVMSVAYGHPIISDDDPYIQIAADASYALGHAGAPAGTPVDFFPLLRYFPSWLGGSSLRFARDWRWAIRKFHDVPFAAVQEEMVKGVAQPSFIYTLLERFELAENEGEVNKMTLEDVKGAAGTIYAAGQDTTWSTLVVFMINMVLHPEVQMKAQTEIDAVVGPDRLPEFSDQPSLRYIEYIVQETFRWYPVSPLGVPHKSLKDDVYRGMFIPKGSIVLANAFSMCRDDSVYQSPDAFNPDRFIPQSEGGRGEPFPSGGFGFGRRVCPGQHFATASIWAAIAVILATLDIRKDIGLDGKEITPKVVFTAGLTSHPEPFKCAIRARSKRAVDLVMQAVL